MAIVQNIKKVSIGGVLATAAFIGGGLHENSLDVNRYPTNIEYALIDECAHAHGKVLSRSAQIEKLEECFCAITGLQGEYDFKNFTDSPNLVRKQLDIEVTNCQTN